MSVIRFTSMAIHCRGGAGLVPAQHRALAVSPMPASPLTPTMQQVGYPAILWPLEVAAQ
jgi:hypothetical protein